MEPVLANGTYAIDLRRYVGELGNESSIALNLAFAVDEVPGLRGLWGTIAEALDEAPAVWIAGELRNEPAIAAALADDRPASADPVDQRVEGSVAPGVVDLRSAGPGLPP